MTVLPVERAVVAELRARIPDFTFSIGTVGETAHCSVTRVGGDTAAYQPVDQPMLQLDIWGDLKGLPVLEYRTEQISNALRWGVVTRNNLRMYEPTVVSVVWLPDENTDRPRYIITITLAALRVAA